MTVNWQSDRHVTTDMRSSMTKDMFYWILARNRFFMWASQRQSVCVCVCVEMTGNMAVLRWPRYTTADELILSFHLNVTITCYVCVCECVSECMKADIHVYNQSLTQSLSPHRPTIEWLETEMENTWNEVPFCSSLFHELSSVNKLDQSKDDRRAADTDVGWIWCGDSLHLVFITYYCSKLS